MATPARRRRGASAGVREERRARGDKAEQHGHPQAHHGAHGNPEDLAGYLARMESPDRAEWQKPDQVLAALGVRAGQTVCEVGIGPGYFALRLAQKVGRRGLVYAVDVEPRVLDAFRERLVRSGLRNVLPVLALPEDPLVPAGACDLILVVNTLHHFEDKPAYLRRLARSLKPGGKLVNIDFFEHELPVGPAPAHNKVSREEFLKFVRGAKLRVLDEEEFLPYQYFFVLQPR
jgi:ubiquinone/menaquinone biosynthesis C-methylase UbiE